MPASEFIGNWAYMVICYLAWNIKSWMGLLIDEKEKSDLIVKCEFKSFQNRIINLPCQILNTGRRIIFRFINYNSWIETIFILYKKIKALRFSTAY